MKDGEMRIAILVAVTAMAIGCEKKSGEEVATYTIPAAWLSRLEKGQEVQLVTQAPDKAPRKEVYVTVPEGDGEEGGAIAIVPVSTKAVVVDDTQSDQPLGKRKVQVKIAEGKHDGKVGEVLRQWIRVAN